MKRCLAGRRILVTGASGGIGQSIAEQAAAKGAKVALAARSADKLAEIVGRIRASGGMAEAIVTDITSREGRSRLLASIAERWGGVDILVNNAGIGSFGHFAESSEDVLRQIMEVNFFAPAELIRLALPILKEGVQPAIVNVASMCGRRGRTGLVGIQCQQVCRHRPE